MRKSTLSLALAFVALVAFSLAPLSAEAGSRRRGDSQGFFFKFGDGGFRWHDNQITYVENDYSANHHYDEYQRYERRLIEKRDRLVYKTEKALRHGHFEKAQHRLTRLIEIDYQLKEHYAAHATCNH